MTDFIHIENYRRKNNKICPVMDIWANRAAVIWFKEVLMANPARREDPRRAIDITFMGGTNQVLYFIEDRDFAVAMCLLITGVHPGAPRSE